MTNEKLTFENIIKLVCEEMGYTPAELSTPRLKSEVKMYIAKFLATHFLKTYHLGTNNQIKKALGYSIHNDKTLKRNKQAMQRAIELNDELVIPHFNNISAKLFDEKFTRPYNRQDLTNLRISIVKEDVLEKCKASNVYPFVIRTANQLFYGYAMDGTGMYIGQTEQEYKAAIL